MPNSRAIVAAGSYSAAANKYANMSYVPFPESVLFLFPATKSLIHRLSTCRYTYLPARYLPTYYLPGSTSQRTPRPRRNGDVSASQIRLPFARPVSLSPVSFFLFPRPSRHHLASHVTDEVKLAYCGEQRQATDGSLFHYVVD